MVDVIPYKNLRLKLSNQQLRIAIELRLGSKVCEKQMRLRKKNNRRWMAWPILSQKCREVLWACKFECPHRAKSRLHSQSFVLQPRHLQRTDQKRPDRQHQWDVTVIDPLVTSRISAGSVCNPETAAAEAEDQRSDKYRELTNDKG